MLVFAVITLCKPLQFFFFKIWRRKIAQDPGKEDMFKDQSVGCVFGDNVEVSAGSTLPISDSDEILKNGPDYEDYTVNFFVESNFVDYFKKIDIYAKVGKSFLLLLLFLKPHIVSLDEITIWRRLEMS